MKRVFASLFAFVLIISMCSPVFAAEQGTVVLCQEIDLGDGIVVIDTIVEYSTARALGKAATRTKEIYDDGVLIGVITLLASFIYDGTTVTVNGMSVSRKDTYEGWSFKQNSLTASGNTVILDAKLTRLLFLNIPFTISITCDANGNLS